MPKREARNPASAKGDWSIDDRCIDCAASREVAPGLIVERGGRSVFARQPVTEHDARAAWRAVLLCPTASIGKAGRREQPPDLFPQEIERGIYRCGYNARSSFGAHSYFIQRKEGNVLIDSPRYVAKLVEAFERVGGLTDVLLSHQDDVADAEKYADRFSARVWIHDDDRSAAAYATNVLEGTEMTDIAADLIAITVPGHTRGSVVYLWRDISRSKVRAVERTDRNRGHPRQRGRRSGRMSTAFPLGLGSLPFSGRAVPTRSRRYLFSSSPSSLRTRAWPPRDRCRKGRQSGRAE